jgi:dTDP-4-dehydrorhamnose 3,5-epimerase-like enzyme
MFLRSDMAHAFQALEDNTVVSYLVSSEYSPTHEKEISPMCSMLNVQWSEKLLAVFSEKDQLAPNTAQQAESNLLPIFRN